MKRIGIMIILLLTVMTLAGCEGRPPRDVDCIISISHGHMRIIRDWREMNR